MNPPDLPVFSAIIVAGGKSSRLGGTPKASLSNGKHTLLESTLLAVEDACERVVVGPADLPLPAQITLTREDPPFSGPAAAITAGIRALGEGAEKDAADWVMVLAVDMPRSADLVGALRKATADASAEVEGFFGVCGGVSQPLAGIYRYEKLKETFNTDTSNRSVRKFLNTMNLQAVELPPGLTDDVDTWDSAHQSGFDAPQWS